MVELTLLADFKFAQSDFELSQEVDQRNAQRGHCAHEQSSGALHISGAEKGAAGGDEHQTGLAAADQATEDLQANGGLTAPDGRAASSNLAASQHGRAFNKATSIGARLDMATW